MRLTSNEIALVLEALRVAHGPGYSDSPEVGRLQAKLSVMREVAEKMEAMVRGELQGALQGEAAASGGI